MVFRIIQNELCMRRICARWIPHKIDEKVMRKKRPIMLQTAILHHDNLSHRVAQTTETIKRLGFELLDHPSYSPDLAPCDLFLFFYQECFERYAI